MNNGDGKTFTTVYRTKPDAAASGVMLSFAQNIGKDSGSNFKVEDAIYSEWALDPSISMDETGNFNVAWRDNRNDAFDIFCRQFSSNGTALGNSFQVNDEHEADYRHSPCISTNTNGNFIIAWTNNNNSNNDVYAQQYLSDGTTYGNNYRISITDIMDQSAASVALKNSRIFTTWHDNHDEQTGYNIWANVNDWDFWVGIENNITDKTPPLPYLHQNYPNPFTTSTIIKFDLPEAAKVKIEIFNHFGQNIETILEKFMPPGLHEVGFVAEDLPDGVYFYRIVTGSNCETGGFQQARGMVVAR